MNTYTNYPGFKYPHNLLDKYIEAAGLFTIMLTDKSIIHFKPEDIASFRTWLKTHNILDIKQEAI